jgi:hypothetical protein
MLGFHVCAFNNSKIKKYVSDPKLGFKTKLISLEIKETNDVENEGNTT